jgi:hypothetical protein
MQMPTWKAVCPTELLRDDLVPAGGRLNDADKLVFLALRWEAKLADHCSPGVPTLMARLSKSRATIHRSLHRLIATGWITRVETGTVRVSAGAARCSTSCPTRWPPRRTVALMRHLPRPPVSPARHQVSHQRDRTVSPARHHLLDR